MGMDIIRDTQQYHSNSHNTEHIYIFLAHIKRFKSKNKRVGSSHILAHYQNQPLLNSVCHIDYYAVPAEITASMLAGSAALTTLTSVAPTLAAKSMDP